MNLSDITPAVASDASEGELGFHVQSSVEDGFVPNHKRVKNLGQI